MNMNENNWQVKVYKSIASKPVFVKRIFLFIYILILIFLGFAIYVISTGSTLEALIYQTGVWAGRTAISILAFVVLPGILGRFRIEIPITRIITAYRRQFGILVFLLAFSHASIVRMIPKLLGILPIFPLILFETFGLLALSILSFMFLTSNNFSVKKLGKNWKRLHRFIYVVLWLLALHTGLQRISIWSALIFSFASLEIISLIYDFMTKRNSGALKTKDSG